MDHLEMLAERPFGNRYMISWCLKDNSFKVMPNLIASFGVWRRSEDLDGITMGPAMPRGTVLLEMKPSHRRDASCERALQVVTEQPLEDMIKPIIVWRISQLV